MPRKKINRELAVIDFETDPFLFGRIPRPFCAGFYTKGKYIEFWGATCVTDLVNFLLDSPQKYIIYAHNGGKFDFFFILKWLQNPLKIINGRIAKAYLADHELRDSYSILPIPLSAYQKDEIDYKLFESNQREKHRTKILKYLESDCKYLFTLVENFTNRFGFRLTIGGAAIAELEKIHPFERTMESHDNFFRPYYFGGRVECFETGILHGDFKIYDVNSMYPFVMANCHHPTGRGYTQIHCPAVNIHGEIAGCETATFYFVRLFCKNFGAFPTRLVNEPLSFDIEYGEFYVTSHEYIAAVELGLISDVKVISASIPTETVMFADFVEVFSKEKIAAKKEGNKTNEIFAKLILNSAYGKFGSDCSKYKDYYIESELNEPLDSERWTLSSVHEIDDISVWEKPANVKRYFDVATAASITGAARAVLMRAMAKAKRPIYCDTDSIICEGLDAEFSDFELGKWKLESTGDVCAIARKKIYCLTQNGISVKKAHKGAILSDAEIFKIAKGGSVSWQKDAPSFSLTMGVRFIDRNIQ